jgi:hypothetical protein
MRLRRVTAGRLEGDTAATWRERQADLRSEAGTIAHVHHTLTAEENGLWNAMQNELDEVTETVAGFAREACAP